MSLPPFDEVVRVHGPVVLRVCRAVLGPVDAQDAWSETFLAALRAYPQLDGDANIQAWLVTIAHRRALDVVRAARRAAEPVADIPEQPDHRADPGERVTTPVIWDAVAQLPTRQRQVIAYRYLAGLAFREVAQVVGISDAAARRAGSDGIARLRAAMAT